MAQQQCPPYRPNYVSGVDAGESNGNFDPIGFHQLQTEFVEIEGNFVVSPKYQRSQRRKHHQTKNQLVPSQTLSIRGLRNTLIHVLTRRRGGEVWTANREFVERLFESPSESSELVRHWRCRPNPPTLVSLSGSEDGKENEPGQSHGVPIPSGCINRDLAKLNAFEPAQHTQAQNQGQNS